MGNCCSGTAVAPSLPPPPSQVAMDPVPLPVLSHAGTDRSSIPSAQPLSQTRGRTGSRPESTARSRLPSQDPDPRARRRSVPEPPPGPLMPEMSRPRTKSAANPRNTTRSESRPRSTGHSRSKSLSGRKSLNSTVEQVLTGTPQFRILIVGKRGSGKSSLINAAFRVNMSVAVGRGPDINFPFRPEDNHRLVVHEYSGLEPGDAQGLRTVLNFISNRTNPNCAPTERLHAIWWRSDIEIALNCFLVYLMFLPRVCVLTSDAISGSIGEGFNEILNTRTVPVVIAFTKSDLAFPHISGSESGYNQRQDRTMTRAYAQCEQLCRSLFRKEARDVPAELVSVMPQYNALFHNLIATTDRLMMGSRTAPSSRPSPQRAKSRIAPAHLIWSVALRASRDITIQASIEIGRNQYWRSLWSSLDFTGQTLRNCVNVIHLDIVEIWNLYDGHRYLSSNQFKISMSHVIKDLDIPAGSGSPSDWNVSEDKLADWVHDVYRGSQENVRCVMGYIVNLTVILDVIFRTSGSVTGNAVPGVISNHISSGRRDSIHRDIRSFVSATFSIRSTPDKDLILENIINLIRRHCAQ